VDIHCRVTIDARRQVTKQFTLAAFTQHRHLVAGARQERHRATRRRTVQHGAIDDAIVTVEQAPFSQLGQGCANTSAQQLRLANLRASQRNNAISVKLASGEQLADGNNVLVTDGPDTLAGADRVKEVDMGAGVARRMRTSKGFFTNLAGGK